METVNGNYGILNLGLNEDQAERYKVLVDGVPQEVREPLIAWLKHLR